MSPSRRTALIAAVAALGLASAAGAADKVRTVDLKKVFPFLDLYWRLPSAERSRFQLVYRFKLTGAPMMSLRASYVVNGQRTPMRLSPGGQIENPPPPSALNGGQAELVRPEAAKLALEVEVSPTAAPATQMDARDLAEAVHQAGAAVHKAAGLASFAAPKMERIVFKGAAGGQMVDAAGRVTPLPVKDGAPVFDPAAAPAARTLRFSHAPSAMLIGPAK